MEFTKETLIDALTNYFGINNEDGTYTYELTRVKEAFSIGTMTMDDFVEWDEEQIDDLAQFLYDRFYKSNAEAVNEKGELNERNYN